MWGYSTGWGYGPSGGLGLVLLIVLILILVGRIQRRRINPAAFKARRIAFSVFLWM